MYMRLRFKRIYFFSMTKWLHIRIMCTQKLRKRMHSLSNFRHFIINSRFSLFSCVGLRLVFPNEWSETFDETLYFIFLWVFMLLHLQLQVFLCFVKLLNTLSTKLCLYKYHWNTYICIINAIWCHQKHALNKTLLTCTIKVL